MHILIGGNGGTAETVSYTCCYSFKSTLVKNLEFPVNFIAKFNVFTYSNRRKQRKRRKRYHTAETVSYFVFMYIANFILKKSYSNWRKRRKRRKRRERGLRRFRGFRGFRGIDLAAISVRKLSLSKRKFIFSTKGACIHLLS